MQDTPQAPQTPQTRKPIRGLALSGGGFRATLFHLGVISYLYDVEWAWNAAKKAEANKDEDSQKPSDGENALTGIRSITSVSGGSIIAAHLVQNWDSYTNFDDPSKFAEAANKIVRFIKMDVRGRIVRRIPFNFAGYWLSVIWRRLPFKDDKDMPQWMRRSTTDSLERHYHKYLYDRASLGALTPNASPGRTGRPKLFLLTTNLADPNKPAAFTARQFSSTGEPHKASAIPLSLAVAASSAFPGMFPAVIYHPLDGNGPKEGYKLADGGIYDNLGVRKFWDLLSENQEFDDILVSDASTGFKPTFGLEFLEPFTLPVKAADILFRRVHWFEERDAKAKGDATHKCQFHLLKLRHEFDENYEPQLVGDLQSCLHSTRTDLDSFSDTEIAALIRHGYCVARHKLHYDLPGSVDSSTIPSWTPQAKDVVPDLFNHGSPVLRKTVRHLEASSKRRKRFFAITDIASQATLVIIAAVVCAYFFLPLLWAGTVDADAVEIIKENRIQKQEINFLQTISAPSSPGPIDSSWLVPIETNDATVSEALEDTRTNVTSAKGKGFTDVRIFRLKIRNNGKDIVAFRPALVYATISDAQAGRDLAMKQLNPTADMYVSASAFCPRYLWNNYDGFYDCDPSVEAVERRGFELMLQRNLPEAIKHFEWAETIKPGHDSVFEIKTLLERRRKEVESSDAAASMSIWNDIFREAVTNHQFGMPDDIKKTFTELSKSKPPDELVPIPAPKSGS